MPTKLGNIPYSFSFSWIFLATDGPTISVSSSKDAFLILETLLKAFKRAVLRFSPMPEMLSNTDAIWLLLRLSRWKVMANRCTSSWMFSNRWNSGVFCFTPIVMGGNPYNNSEVRCLLSLANPAMGMFNFKSSSITSRTTSICPFPPSVMIRSGRGEPSSNKRE